jgi:hypothetical protein
LARYGPFSWHSHCRSRDCEARLQHGLGFRGADMELWRSRPCRVDLRRHGDHRRRGFSGNRLGLPHSGDGRYLAHGATGTRSAGPLVHRLGGRTRVRRGARRLGVLSSWPLRRQRRREAPGTSCAARGGHAFGNRGPRRDGRGREGGAPDSRTRSATRGARVAAARQSILQKEERQEGVPRSLRWRPRVDGFLEYAERRRARRGGRRRGGRRGHLVGTCGHDFAAPGGVALGLRPWSRRRPRRSRGPASVPDAHDASGAACPAHAVEHDVSAVTARGPSRHAAGRGDHWEDGDPRCPAAPP